MNIALLSKTYNLLSKTCTLLSRTLALITRKRSLCKLKGGELGKNSIIAASILRKSRQDVGLSFRTLQFCIDG